MTPELSFASKKGSSAARWRGEVECDHHVVGCWMQRVCSACAVRRNVGKACAIETPTCSETCTIAVGRMMVSARCGLEASRLVLDWMPRITRRRAREDDSLQGQVRQTTSLVVARLMAHRSGGLTVSLRNQPKDAPRVRAISSELRAHRPGEPGCARPPPLDDALRRRPSGARLRSSSRRDSVGEPSGLRTRARSRLDLRGWKAKSAVSSLRVRPHRKSMPTAGASPKTTPRLQPWPSDRVPRARRGPG